MDNFTNHVAILVKVFDLTPIERSIADILAIIPLSVWICRRFDRLK